MNRMYRRCIVLLLPMMAAALSACNFFAPPAQPIELLDSDPASTQIGELRVTATFVTDRLMMTMDAVNTAVRAVDVQSTRIAATLVERGTPFVDTSMLTPLPPTPAGLNGGSQNVNPGSIASSIAPVITPSGGAQGNTALTPLPAQVNSATTPTPLPSAGDPVVENQTPAGNTNAPLTDIMLSRSVGPDDCATQSTTQFLTTDTEIYVSARAQVAAGSTIRAQFWRDGAEVVSYDWSPTFDVNGACIWFYMPASAVAYTAGNWSVDLSLNGTIAGSVDFTIQ
ncbi:MAG: hypothetical protein U0670_05255 [Anaerolineae bacterium]